MESLPLIDASDQHHEGLNYRTKIASIYRLRKSYRLTCPNTSYSRGYPSGFSKPVFYGLSANDSTIAQRHQKIAVLFVPQICLNMIPYPKDYVLLQSQNNFPQHILMIL
eukprot:NODE_55_length_29507_cov_0.809712.p27 type:complete len:109 gc:universal NODE_55_length_29507_cov_0.809712:13557-13231(-)